MRHSKRSSRGFTLIEILIVVIILGILAAIVIPQFSSASSQASTATIQSEWAMALRKFCESVVGVVFEGGGGGTRLDKGVSVGINIMGSEEDARRAGVNCVVL